MLFSCKFLRKEKNWFNLKRGYLKDVDKIGVRAGRVINRYKMAKHFKFKIDEEEFSFEVDKEKITEEAALDGICVIRTSLKAEILIFA